MPIKPENDETSLGSGLLSHFPDLYRNAFDSISDGVYFCDLQGKLEYANTSFLNYFELSLPDFIGKTLLEISYPFEDFRLFTEEDNRVSISSELEDNFYDFREKPSFKIEQAKTSKAPIFNDDGEFVGISASITHIGQEYLQSNILPKSVKHYQNTQHLTSKISKLTNEKEILWEVASETANLLGFSDLAIYMIDEKDDLLYQKAAYSDRKEKDKLLSPVPLSLGCGLVGMAAFERKTILADNLRSDKRYFRDGIQAASEISVPIYFKDKIFGVMGSESLKPGFFSIKHKDVLEAIASILALKISELRSLKQACENEQCFNQILESSKGLMVYAMDKSYCYKSFNRNHAEVIKERFKVDITIGMNVLDNVVDIDERIEYEQAFERALRGEDLAMIERYEDKEDGSIQFFEKFYSPFYSVGGDIKGVTAFMRDITEEKTSLLKLAERERLIQSINENINDGIFRYSISEGFVYSNHALQEMFASEQPQDRFVDFNLLLVRRKHHLKIFNQILNKGFIKNMEIQFKRFDGSTFWGLLDCTLSEEKNDKVIDGVITDISGMKDLSQSLIKTNSEMDQLVYRTSHDLRAPIASLLGLENLLETTLREPNQLELLSIMKKQLNLLDGIIMDIITYRKVAKLGLSRDEIHLEEMIEKVMDGIQFMDNYDHIRQIRKIDEKTSFFNDSHNVQVILNNLISNAIKYSKKNASDSYVKITIDVDDNRAVLLIEDNGIGIDEGSLKNVFDMFYRATNHATGTGLGLFIVNEAIEKVKGTIEVDSSLGKGSVFRVELPNLIND